MGKKSTTSGSPVPTSTDDFETIDEALKRATKIKLEWTQVDKSNWHAVVDGESLPARIRSLDTETHSCYRNGKYLGHEKTLEDAMKRVIINERSQKNRAISAWERDHPLEIPPILQMTEAERVELRRRTGNNPPVTRASAGDGPARSRGGIGGRDAGDDNDPSTRRLREQMTAREAPQPRAVVTDEAAVPAPPKTKGGNKTAIIAALLTREGGCTSDDVKAATGWTAVSMPQQAKAAGLVLKVDKGRKPFRYSAESK